MPDSSPTTLRKWIHITLAMIPWLGSMYAFWWLDASGTWTSETAHRGKMSVVLMGSGMLLSFLLLSRLAKPR